MNLPKVTQLVSDGAKIHTQKSDFGAFALQALNRMKDELDREREGLQ